MNDLPEKIYKYRSFEGANVSMNYGARTLLNGELFGSSPMSFNDPFDLAMPYKYSKDSFTLDNFCNRFVQEYPFEKKKGKSIMDLKYEAIERYNYIVDNPEKHWEENAKTIAHMDNEFYGILSLSSIYNNTLMWSHYANFHKGFCIGINTLKFLDYLAINYKQYGFKFGPVIYSDQYPIIEFVRDSNMETIYGRCFTKQICWAYESEYRLVLNNKPNEIIKYPENIIDEIYLGCKMTDSHKVEILEFLKINNLHVKVFQMKMSYDRFCLESIPLTY